MLRKGYGGHTKPQQWKKEENERLRGEGDQIKFINIRFERWHIGILQDSVSYVEGRPWRPIQSSKKGRKKKATG